MRRTVSPLVYAVLSPTAFDRVGQSRPIVRHLLCVIGDGDYMISFESLGHYGYKN
jgi:hypothetical protein